MRRLLWFVMVLFLACSKDPVIPDGSITLDDSWLDVYVLEWTQELYTNGRYASTEIYYEAVNASEYDLKFEVYFDVTTDSTQYHFVSPDYQGVVRAGMTRTYNIWFQTNWRKTNTVEITGWKITEIEE